MTRSHSTGGSTTPSPVVSLSAYDDAVPHPVTDLALAARFADIRAARPAVGLTAVRRVVAVVSSSRGGSTMLGELLRRSEGLLALPGEMNPYAAVAHVDGGGQRVLAAELAREIGRPSTSWGAGPEFLAGVWWRLTAQWPGQDISMADVEAAARRAGLSDSGSTTALVSALREAHPAIDPGRYDDVAATPATDLPPLGSVVEMAPYVGFRPWRLATERELETRPLVVATPRNSYRLDLLRALFPAADVRVLHLTRNPTASVNGLIDGWLHHGFHNVAVPEPLDIRDYSDVVPGGRSWWKFDVPPDWRQFTSGVTLAEVCALQWWSAHEAVLDDVAESRCDYLRVRYEDLVGPADARREAACRLAEWLGVPAGPLVRSVVSGVEPKMATVAPAPRRWRRSRHDLAAALAQPKVWEMTARLGYDDWDERLWI